MGAVIDLKRMGDRVALNTFDAVAVGEQSDGNFGKLLA
jgi:hypothetical protein